MSYEDVPLIYFCPDEARGIALRACVRSDNRPGFTDTLPKHCGLKRQTLPCLLSFDGGSTVSAAAVAMGIPAGVTGLDRGNFGRIRTFPPVSVGKIGGKITKGDSVRLDGQDLPQLLARIQTTNTMIHQAVLDVTNFVLALGRKPKSVETRRAYGHLDTEQDALSLAFQAGNWESASSWLVDAWRPPSPAEEVKPFISSLDFDRFSQPREDLIILSDRDALDELHPKWKIVTREPYWGALILKDGDKEMRIVYANQQPLEHTFGVDLIYHSVAHKSFCCVQYKRMEGRVGSPACSIDEQLISQLDTMDRWTRLLPQPGHLNDPLVERLGPEPFFFKLCRPFQKLGVPGRLAEGYYLTRSQMRYYAKGRKPFRVPSQENKSLSNSDFSSLMSNGWIGAPYNQSAFLSEIMFQALRSGRSVTVAQVVQRYVHASERSHLEGEHPMEQLPEQNLSKTPGNHQTGTQLSLFGRA